MDKELEDKINLELNFEYLLSNLFGKKNYHGYTGLKTTDEWLSNLIEIIDYIEKSIENSIETTDSFHKRQLHSLCNRTKESIENSKGINQINQNTIIGLVKLIFELIGQYPDNWNLSRLNHKQHYELNKYRQIVYNQTDEQRYYYILRLSETHLRDKIPSYAQLINIFSYECNKDYSNFIKWFKKNHSNYYMEIF